MVIDTSALLAILKVEPEALALVSVLSEAAVKWISTATLLETRLVVERQIGAAGQAELDHLLSAAAISPLPLELSHVHWALEGWRRYGKGRHKAALNLGDCFSYGLARALDAPLLFKGEDFAATDLEPVRLR
jgi:ribonuclease VapC